jgi:hypothetical protein
VVDLFAAKGDAAVAAAMAGMDFPTLVARILGLGPAPGAVPDGAPLTQSPLTLYETA